VTNTQTDTQTTLRATSVEVGCISCMRLKIELKVFFKFEQLYCQSVISVQMIMTVSSRRTVRRDTLHLSCESALISDANA